MRINDLVREQDDKDRLLEVKTEKAHEDIKQLESVVLRNLYSRTCKKSRKIEFRADLVYTQHGIKDWFYVTVYAGRDFLFRPKLRIVASGETISAKETPIFYSSILKYLTERTV